MRILFLNPNSTEAMTEGIVRTASGLVPDAVVVGWTNYAGPATIEGAEDNRAAIPGFAALSSRSRQEIRSFGSE